MSETILMKLGIENYTKKLKDWVGKQIENSSVKVGGLKYDEEYQKLYVIGESKNGQKGTPIGDGIDMSQFISLGILSDVQQGENGQFTFTFKTVDSETGEESTVVHTVNFGEFVNSYTGDGKTIALNTQNNAFSVIGVDSSVTKFSNDIPVTGGPMESIFKSAGITNLKDMKLEDILKKLVCKELWPSVESSAPYLSPSVNLPTLTYNNKNKNNDTSTVEIGSIVSYSVSNGASSCTASPAKASGFTYGYSEENNDTKEFSNNIVLGTVGSVDIVENSKATLEITFGSNSPETITASASSSQAGSVLKTGTVTIKKGSNKISVRNTSVNYTCDFGGLPVYYGCSNLGNTDKEIYSDAVTDVTKTSGTATSKYVMIDCVGEYKVFFGSAQQVPTEDKALASLTSKFGGGDCGDGKVIGKIVVAIPTGWDFTIKNVFNTPEYRNGFKLSETKIKHTLENGEKIEYDVWWEQDDGGTYKELNIIANY